MRSHVLIWILLISCLFILDANGQIVARERSDEWNKLVYGGRFMDRFLAMPVQGELTSETWGADNVRPRYIDNGVEDNEWSYWGGNAVPGIDGKYHLYVCRWREDSRRGHMEWSRSIVVHAVADKPTGPYKVKDTIGPGHNPEVFQLKDGRYVVYVIGGYYIADSVEVAAGTVPSLKPFQKTTVELTCGKIFKAGIAYTLKVIINPDVQYPVTFERRITPVP